MAYRGLCLRRPTCPESHPRLSRSNRIWDAPRSSSPASLASATTTHQRPSSSTKTDKRQTSPDREQWLLQSIALGSLIYSFHERLSDISSLVAWSWSGFPISPHPHVHAPLTILAQVLGALLALALRCRALRHLPHLVPARDSQTSPLTHSFLLSACFRLIFCTRALDGPAILAVSCRLRS